MKPAIAVEAGTYTSRTARLLKSRNSTVTFGPQFPPQSVQPYPDVDQSRPRVTVDRFYDAEANLGAAVVQNPFDELEVNSNGLGDFGGATLPSNQ